MLTVKITENSELYRLRWWLCENIGTEGRDWWLTPLKSKPRRSAYDPFVHEMDVHFLSGAHEMFCQLGMTGRYFEVWNSEDIQPTI